MEQKEIMKNTLKNTLFNELQFYNIQYCYLCDLREIWQDIESFREITAKAKTFFSVSLCAIKDDYFLTLSRLYDKTNNANTKSIPNLIIKFQKNLHLFDNDPSINDMLNQFNQKINNDSIISIAIKGIRKKRDSILAHTDKEYFGNKIFKESIDIQLNLEHLSVLQEFTKQVIDYLYSIFEVNSSKSKSILPYYKHDLKNL